MTRWLLAHLPAGLRRRLVERKAAAWLRRHRLREEVVVDIVQGYRTWAAGIALIGGGLAAAVRALEAQDWPGVGQGVAAVGAGLLALGIRFDMTHSVRLGAIGTAAAGVGMIAGGVAHGFDFGEITAGVTMLGGALAGLGIHLSAPAVDARATRASRAAQPGAREFERPSAW